MTREPLSDHSSERRNTTEDDCGYFDVSRRSLPDYRAECYAAGGEEPPAWIPAETVDGEPRTEAQARKIVADWWGEADEPWKVSRVQMYVGQDEYGDLRVHPKPEGMSAGPFDFYCFEEC